MLHVLGQRAVQFLQHHIGKTEDGVERCAQLMGHVGQEGGLQAVQFAQPVDSLLQFRGASFILLGKPEVLDMEASTDWPPLG